MKRLLLTCVALILPACSGDGGGSPLDGNWINFTSQTSAVALTFNSDGTYSAQVLAVTNLVTDGNGNLLTLQGDDQQERGVFADSGSSISFHPTRYTCAGPDPDYSAGYSFQQGRLALDISGTLATFDRNTAKSSSAFALTLGCFAQDGTFSAMPFMNVQN